VEFVVRCGPALEALVMARELGNPHFRFLFDNQSPAHGYYRWRLFSLLHGDSADRWRTAPFRMFRGGSLWQPPPLNRYTEGEADEDYAKARLELGHRKVCDFGSCFI
jgi:U2-associated protein SR140